MLSDLTVQLDGGTSLSPGQVSRAVQALVDAAVTPEAKASFLTALARKGETVDELAAFARELRELSVTPPVDAETRARTLVDVCGTGGDRLGTFNISTTVALVVAAAGVPVAKHGNRAITSRAGSADVLEALGVPIELDPGEAARSLRERGFAFFFAPRYHPAFKQIGPARRLCAERGQRTIFNFLGPLLNPARPAAQLVGVPRPELCEPLARVLQSLGVRRGMVVCGEAPSGPAGAAAHDPARWVFLDELSTLGPSTVAEFHQERGFCLSTLSPAAFPVQPATLADLAGADAQTNAQTVRNLLSGTDRGPRRDAVALNAAAALFLAGRCGSLGEGWAAVERLLEDGRAAAKLAELAARSPGA